MIDQEKLRAKIEDLKHAFAVIHSKSLDESVEMGFVICKKDEELFPGGTCRGDKCHVLIKNCIEGVSIGTYHTHPSYKKDPIPTGADLISIIRHGKDIECVSATDKESKKDVVVCYKFTKETETYKDIKRRIDILEADIDRLNYEIAVYNEELVKYERLKHYKAIMELTKKHDELLKKAAEAQERGKKLMHEAEDKMDELIKKFVEFDLGYLRELKIPPVELIPPEEEEIER